MPRKIYVIVNNSADDMCLISILSGNNQNEIHPFEFNFKTEAPHLQFFDKLRSLVNLTQIKAIAFILCMEGFKSFKEFYGFRQNCYKICKSNGILYFSHRQSIIEAFLALSQTKTLVKEGEQVSIITSVFGKIQGTTVIREKNYYRHFKNHLPTMFMRTSNWKKEFLNKSNPKKVIFLNTLIGEPGKELKKMFDCRQETLNIYANCLQNAVIEMIHHAMGEKISSFNIPNMFGTRGIIHIAGCSSIMIEEGDVVPFEKSVVLDASSSETLMFAVKDYLPKPDITLKQINLSSFKCCTKVKVTLKVDANAFYELKAEPFDPEKLNEKISRMNISESVSIKNAKFIFDKQNFSVFAGDDDNNMQIIKDSDELEKIPIYVAFINDQRPKVGNVAKEFYNEKPDSVIFDLIKICSISNADVINPKWGFKLGKEEDESIFILFESIDGETKASAALVLAFILKHGLGMIKNKTGKKMNEIEVGFDGFTPNEILKKNFIEAAKLKKVDIIFV